MPDLYFSHEAVRDSRNRLWKLQITTGANDIEWGYGLNTVTYPTYGGQVIQILSAFVDDITLTGNVKSYKGMETIYRWFARYMAVATAGENGSYEVDSAGHATAYNQVPVKMTYPERGWEFKIYPKSLPGFIYSTETIAPQWTIKAAMAQTNPELNDAILSIEQFNQIAETASFDPRSDGAPDDEQGKRVIDKLTRSLTPNLVIKDHKLLSTGVFSDPSAPQKGATDYTKKLGDYYHNLVDVYLKGSVPELAAPTDASRPYIDKGSTNLNPSNVTKSSTKNKKP